MWHFSALPLDWRLYGPATARSYVRDCVGGTTTSGQRRCRGNGASRVRRGGSVSDCFLSSALERRRAIRGIHVRRPPTCPAARPFWFTTNLAFTTTLVTTNALASLTPGTSYPPAYSMAENRFGPEMTPDGRFIAFASREPAAAARIRAFTYGIRWRALTGR